jgi:DNA-binding response OmpR family regulator
MEPWFIGERGEGMNAHSTPGTILIIEDDKKTASLVALYLERDGFETIIAHDGQKGLQMAEDHEPVFVILDLMLPKMDGWDVCRELRRHSDVPVLMLTARGEEIDRVSGLTMGADDYMVKPFSPRELTARVKAILRRTGPGAHRGREKDKLVHENIVMDLTKRRLTIDERQVMLTPHEYALLKALMASPGKAFTRDELLDRIYPAGSATVIDRVVDVHINKLRQKIETDPSHPRYILTAWGVGYRFADSISF